MIVLAFLFQVKSDPESIRSHFPESLDESTVSCYLPKMETSLLSLVKEQDFRIYFSENATAAEKIVFQEVMSRSAYSLVLGVNHLAASYVLKLWRSVSTPVTDTLSENLRQLMNLKAKNVVSIKDLVKVSVGAMCIPCTGILMERCRTDLLSYFKVEGSLSNPFFESLRFIATEILKGYTEIHSDNIAHRDVRPQNILVNVNPLEIKLSDFGVTRWFSGEDSYESGPKSRGMDLVQGKFMWTSPEALSCVKVIDHVRADLWGIGW